MNQNFATGDRVAWTERDRGIVVAADPPDAGGRRIHTVAVWRDGRFTGHVTRIAAAALYTTRHLGGTITSTER